jgi:hypothetical protein
MNRTLYALHDSKPSGALKIEKPEHAHELNKQGYGIFHTVNSFEGLRRITHLKKLNSWYVELDEGEKYQQLAAIMDSPVLPNLIVESKRGYQLYWDAREATVDNYVPILKELQRFFGGDSKASDIARLLRAPGFNHMKDPADPFEVRAVWKLPGTYSEAIMLHYFPTDVVEEDRVAKPTSVLRVHGDSFWKKVDSMDCMAALQVLSGSSYVNYERYTFRPTARGRFNIWVNGKSSSCFIDENRKIGAKAGPHVGMWLKYFNHSTAEVVRILKHFFPELEST